jgi:hypothetical protein
MVTSPVRGVRNFLCPATRVMRFRGWRRRTYYRSELSAIFVDLDRRRRNFLRNKSIRMKDTSVLAGASA